MGSPIFKPLHPLSYLNYRDPHHLQQASHNPFFASKVNHKLTLPSNTLPIQSENASKGDVVRMHGQAPDVARDDLLK